MASNSTGWFLVFATHAAPVVGFVAVLAGGAQGDGVAVAAGAVCLFWHLAIYALSKGPRGRPASPLDKLQNTLREVQAMKAKADLELEELRKRQKGGKG